ncbi:MAG: AAA family ATPase [Microcystaceae cyanobacterium]
MALFLKSAQIINYKSLANVTLNFRDLTILVGANSSGKSNCLKALYFLSVIIAKASPPPIEMLKKIRKINIKEDITFIVKIKEDALSKSSDNRYKLSVGFANQESIFSEEKLIVNNIQVIDIKNGQGKVVDEDGSNEQKYKSRTGNLALKSAGDFGHKPITSKIVEFIGEWEVYDLDPDIIRGGYINFESLVGDSAQLDTFPRLDSAGKKLEEVLSYWSANHPDKLFGINQDLNKCLGINLKSTQEDGETIIIVQEKGGLEIPLSDMSDGTLRIIAYYVLLFEDNLPPLIGIEEPERNLNPGLFLPLSTVLKKLSKKTQLIITTHSSQLLDCFTLEEIQEDVMVLCLSKIDNQGTQVFELDELGQKREDLADWMQDFGVGSAVYNSNLLEECLEEQYA